MILNQFHFLTLLLLFTCYLQVATIDYEEIQLEDEYETRARIIMLDGNVFLHAGRDKNITFKTNGNGKIYVQNTDVSKLPDTASFNDLKGRFDAVELDTRQLRKRTESSFTIFRVLITSLRTINQKAQNLTVEVEALKKWRNDRMEREEKRRSLLSKMIRNIIKLKGLLLVDACNKKPCKNGATCIPHIGHKFTCLCPPHFTGKTCEDDVNECEIYNGTIAGCQNNGTCVNKPEGFQCECTNGYHGPLCQYQMSSCSRSFELCGPHGHCVDIDTNDSSKPKYKCLCDWGYKMSADTNNPTCVDVNECETNPCHPGVDCINLPGTFKCHGCPVGYKEYGNTCIDINECEENDVFPCDPLSKCINTIGSFQCEACPPGFDGDGSNCVPTDPCLRNDCHEHAICLRADNSLSANGYICRCPDDYAGDGIGENGCIRSNSTACKHHICLNGALCQPLNDTNYRCDCPLGYTGEFCEKVDECKPNPCKNGAKCVVKDGQRQCYCRDGFFGDLCDEQESNCDRHINYDNGDYDFAMNSSVPVVCDIVIDLSMFNSLLRINFTNFDSFSPIKSIGATDCTTTTANLTIFDGSNANAPTFATFCGDRNSVKAPLINEPITMTSTKALLRFHGTRGSFSIKWTTKERSCGYRTSEPSGILQVPSNKQDVVCEWFISAPAQKIIEIEVPMVDMHSKDVVACEQNELEIFDGYSAYSLHRITNLCANNEKPFKVKSTGPFLTVSFISNMLPSASGLKEIRGFDMHYKFIDSDRKCGGDFINSNDSFTFNGVIESPNYGSLYPPNMDCTWRINGSFGSNKTNQDALVLKLTTEEFDVPSSSLRIVNDINWRFVSILHKAMRDRTRIRSRPSLHGQVSCVDDYLKIYNGQGDLAYDACNSQKPPNELIVSDSEAVLQFHSNAARQGKGFKIYYELMCQKKYSGNGTIQSWNYPSGSSGKPGKCTYWIQAPPTHIIQIKFKTIGLRVIPQSECFHSQKDINEYPNYIEFEGGRLDNNVFNRRYVCSKYPFVEENTITVVGSRPVKITVASDGNPNFKGLSLEYTTKHVGCGGIYSSMVGEIASPNYPEKYHPHMHCVYDIYVSWFKSVKLTFDVFDLEVTASSLSCEYDRVEIYTEYLNETSHGKLIGKFCGAMLPPVIYSPGNTLTVVFVSDRSVSSLGFHAKYEAIDRKTSCDETFTAPTGNIIFDNTEEHKFNKCSYHIALGDNQRIVLKMNNMTIPCMSSKLKFYNGPSEKSPGFGGLHETTDVCDDYPMPVIRSTGNRVMIVLTTTDSKAAKFNISYEVSSVGCGGRIDGLSGSISSPQYPLTDGRTLNCEWKISVAKGNKIRFTISELDDLKSSDNLGFCGPFALNRIDLIENGLNGQHLLKRYCKKEIAPEPLLTDSDELIVNYRQSGGLVYGKLYGFLARFTTICRGIRLESHQGSIQSPGYPHKVNGAQFCDWTIVAPPGNRIVAKFHRFTLDHAPFATICKTRNMLKIDDTTIGKTVIRNRADNSTNVFCGNVAEPLSITSKHNILKLTYNSDKPQNQFWLDWHTIGCTGEIRAPQNLLINKDSIDMELGRFECQYRVIAPVGKRVELVINSFDILPTVGNKCEYGSDVQMNGMAVFMSSSNASGFAQYTACETVKNKVYVSHTDQMFIHITLSTSNLIHDNFFNGSIRFVDLNQTDSIDCGGVVELTIGETTRIHSPNYPKPYPSGIRCEWIFRAPAGYHVEFDLEEYHSPNYHEQKQLPGNEYRFFDPRYPRCKNTMEYADGMLIIYQNSTKDVIVDKLCQESNNSTIVTTLYGEPLVRFTGAKTLIGRKTGELVRERNGFVLAATPRCGGVHLAVSKRQTVSLFHSGEKQCNVTFLASDGDDPVVVRVEKYKKRKAEHVAGDDDFIRVYKDSDEVSELQLASNEDIMQEYVANSKIMVSVNHADAPHDIILSYSTEQTACGGHVKHSSGSIRQPKRAASTPYDCTWLIDNTDGNGVEFTVRKLELNKSPLCTDSYLEIREFNQTGKLLTRICEMVENDQVLLIKKYKAKSLWVHLRYRPTGSSPIDVDELEPMRIAPGFWGTFSRVSGGFTTSNVIEKPITDESATSTWVIGNHSKHQVLVHFEKVYLVHPDSFLEFREYNVDAGEPYAKISGAKPVAELLLPYELVQVKAKFAEMDDFKIRWESVPLEYSKGSPLEADAQYDCGTKLVPTWEWQDISNPLPAGQTHGYEENIHCRWTLTRPTFAGLEVKFDYLDLENDENCNYDFVALIPQNDEDEYNRDLSKYPLKHCELSKSNRLFKYTINRVLHVHFISDRSRHGRGFKLSYRLNCDAFVQLLPNMGLEHVLTSPGYPVARTEDTKCQWSIIAMSNRKLDIEVVDLDMEDEENCKDDEVLIMSSKIVALYSSSPMFSKFSKRICGNTRANFSTSVGRVYIKYTAKASTKHKGFKMIIREKMTECPSDILHIDESMPSKRLYSPEWPEVIPHSVECEYLMSAPNGHRVALTFDEDNFDLEQTDGGNCTDYVELYDGSSLQAPFIGKYCGHRPPSTIYSTSNMLYMRLHTDQYINSRRLSAKYEIATCGGTITVMPNETVHVTSPNYPNVYSSPVSCEWIVNSPNTHMLQFKVEHLWLSYDSGCKIEKIHLIDNINSTFAEVPKPICSARNSPTGWIRSSSSRMVIRFDSNSTAVREGRDYCRDRKCGFDIAIKLSETGCGGEINDATGIITAPGYPNKLLPRVRCMWTLSAGAGFVYRLNYKFANEGVNAWHKYNDFGRAQACNHDIIIQQSDRHESGWQKFKSLFCQDKTEIFTDTDYAEIVYDDAVTRILSSGMETVNANHSFYEPFIIEYTKVAIDSENKGCSFLANSNISYQFANSTTHSRGSIYCDRLCHIEISKPVNFNTVWVKVLNYSNMSSVANEFDLKACLPWQSQVGIFSKAPTPLHARICERSVSNNRLDLIYLNDIIDVNVYNPGTFKQSFIIEVEFQECGGKIKQPGIIKSPNYNEDGSKKYLPNSRCYWLIEAPKGQLVQVKVLDMKIEYDHDCDKDHLIIGEGHQQEINPIHKYCHNINGSNEVLLEDRFKVVKSHSRYITIVWSTNENIEEKGWKLSIDFINEDNTCGFHARGMSGVITSPNYGVSNYDNDLECVWDIQVPTGYHVHVKFNSFELEPSPNCSKDSLIISQEHSSRANSPIGDYYFLFQDEEKHDPMCGGQIPNDFHAESNRIRLNFTTNDAVQLAGFSLNWNAECRATFRLNHGVISSPHYPTGYPNEKLECLYYIQPSSSLDSVVALKFQDLQLSPTRNSFDEKGCEMDYIQVIEVTTNKTVLTICGNEPAPMEALAIKGAVGIKFVVEESSLWRSMPDSLKSFRGFQISYTINECGRDYHLTGDQLSTVITSPAFPLDYAHDLNCIWNITTDEDRVINIKIEKMDIEFMDDCSADSLEFFDGKEANEENSISKLCHRYGGQNGPAKRIVSTKNGMIIRLLTDFSASGSGFKLVASATLGPKAGCGGSLKATEEWQTLSSPKDENGNYPNGLKCGWTISGPIDTQIELRIDGIDTEKLEYPPGDPPIPKCVDSLAIFDGVESFSPSLAKDICTSQTPPPSRLFSSHRHAFVFFDTDDDGNAKGFNLSYRTSQAECGGWLKAAVTSRTMLFKSKTANETSKVNQRCRYMIEGSHTEPVVIHFKSFNVPSEAGDCSDAFVEVRDVGSLNECQHPACAQEPSQRKITRYCGTATPPPHVANTNVVQIIVSAIVKHKEQAIISFIYQTLDNCNRTINLSEYQSGRITSPNYPNPYSTNTTCHTQILANHRKMLIAFAHFTVEGQTLMTEEKPCSYDYLELKTGNSSVRHCGQKMVPTTFTDGSDVDLLFKSDESATFNGFDLTYYRVVSETDDMIRFADSYEREGVVTNIGYPRGYNQSMTQIFTIRPPPSHGCTIIVENVNLAITSDPNKCSSQDEYLEIEVKYQGEVKATRVRDCSFDSTVAASIHLNGDDNDRYIRFTFKSDADKSNDGQGFLVKWKTDDFTETI